MELHPDLRKILEIIGKKGGAEILLSLYSGPKKWLELEKIVKEKKVYELPHKRIPSIGSNTDTNNT